MVNASSTYQPYADERRIKLEASFELIDVDAAMLATGVASTGTFFSQLEQTFDKITYMSRTLATVEPDEWKLDGSYALVRANEFNDETGYWSQFISDENGNTDVRIVYTFETSQTSRGITVTFDDRTGNFATDFKVVAYGADGNEIASAEITNNNSYVVIADMLAENYTKLEINFIRTNKPQRRVRVAEVTFGYLKAFDGNDIVSIKMEYETAIDGTSLPSNKMTLTIDNTDRRYNIINPTGIYRYLQKGQGLNASIIINGERISMGRFYFSSSQSYDNSMTVAITAYDKMYQLDSVTTIIGATGTWTLGEAVAAIVEASGTTIAVDMSDELSKRTINKWIPQETTVREALRLAVQAAKCTCYFDRLDVLTFAEPQNSTFVDHLNNDCMATLPKITDTGLINSVEVKVNNEYVEDFEEIIYTASDIADDEEESKLSISNPLVASADVAEWLLQMSKYRINYDISERGNPARELMDVVNVADVYGENKNGITIKETFTASKGLSGTLKVVTRLE